MCISMSKNHNGNKCLQFPVSSLYFSVPLYILDVCTSDIKFNKSINQSTPVNGRASVTMFHTVVLERICEVPVNNNNNNLSIIQQPHACMHVCIYVCMHACMSNSQTDRQTDSQTDTRSSQFNFFEIIITLFVDN